ncbi:MAG: VanW family protein [Polyangiaceae bacterium]|nr:VanW family protein [Polyangiaceae bacterium]
MAAHRIRGVAAWLLCAGAGALAAALALSTLPPEGATARGLRLAGVEIPEGSHPRAAAEDRARRLLARRVRLTWDGQEILSSTLSELGATADVAAAAADAARVGHDGGPLRRLGEAMEARRGRVDVPIRISLPIEPLAARLDAFKDDSDRAPLDARLDFATGKPTAGSPGRYVDVYAAAAAIDRALARAAPDAAEITAAAPAFEIAPAASPDVVAAIDTSQVLARFETRFGYLGGEANRAQNVRTAASRMDGVVLMPGEIVSFNRIVGARSTDNGFTTAPEIYKGELRDGVGGGTCQVAGTLHAAAFFGGIDIIERASHSRPSGYIRVGLDATVVYPTVDLKLRNPYAFPVVLRATIDKGTLAFELRGRERPVTVEYATATVGVEPYKRKVEEASWLKEGKFVLKQKGIRGLSIRKTRTIHLAGGEDRVEVTTDVYPPTFEIYQVPPGSDAEALLPPPPSEAEPAAAGGAAAPAAALAPALAGVAQVDTPGRPDD